MKKILVLGYEVGNLSSIINSLNSLEIKHIVSDKKTEIKIRYYDTSIVGSFKNNGNNQKKNLFYPIKNAFKEGKKIVGICVGMQICFLW